MPIAYEVVALALLAYTIGLALGWAIWGRSPRSEGENKS
jgi:hypothetical protein